MITLESLPVLVMQRLGYWVVHAVDFDYVAAGSSQEEAMRNFREDLAATIAENIREYGPSSTCSPGEAPEGDGC